MKRRFRIIIRLAYLQTFYFLTLMVKNVHMKANILRIFSSFLRYNKHAKLFVQRWHHFWSSKIDHYFTKQRISIKNVEILSLCKVGHFGIYKNPNGIICSIVLKKKGENNTTEELSPLSVFSKQEELRIQGSDYRNTSLFTRHQQILSHTRNM